MQNMKQFTYYLLMIFFFISCKSNSALDNYMGDWEYSEVMPFRPKNATFYTGKRKSINIKHKLSISNENNELKIMEYGKITDVEKAKDYGPGEIRIGTYNPSKDQIEIPIAFGTWILKYENNQLISNISSPLKRSKQ